MTRHAKIIIFSLILVYSIYNHKSDNSIFDSIPNTKQNNSVDPESKKVYEKAEKQPRTNEDKKTNNNSIEYYSQPKNGFSPYNEFFGKGLYNNDSGNKFTIKNSNSTDAVVLLVDSYSGRKVRNEYIRKGTNFEMTGVPNGTYYLEWASGNNWSPRLRVGNLTGGFQSDASFSKTKNRDDWMSVDGYRGWTVTLYSVSGGDVEPQSIKPTEFGN